MASCAFGDPICPCQDGDICHYVDDPVTGTKAFPPPKCDSCGQRVEEGYAIAWEA